MCAVLGGNWTMKKEISTTNFEPLAGSREKQKFDWTCSTNFKRFNSNGCDCIQNMLFDVGTSLHVKNAKTSQFVGNRLPQLQNISFCPSKCWNV